jgi:hypothetical protein
MLEVESRQDEKITKSLGAGFSNAGWIYSNTTSEKPTPIRKLERTVLTSYSGT